MTIRHWEEKYRDSQLWQVSEALGRDMRAKRFLSFLHYIGQTYFRRGCLCCGSLGFRKIGLRHLFIRKLMFRGRQELVLEILLCHRARFIMVRLLEISI